MNPSLTILYQIGIMFILITFGALMYKLKFISRQANKQLSNFAITIVIPTVILVSYQTDFNSSLLKGLVISLLLAVVSHILFILTAKILLTSKNHPSYDVERFAATYSNCAFLGIPLISSIYGTDGILYLTAYVTVFNCLMWTHGVSLMKKTKDFKSILKALVSPSMIAVFAGIIMFVTQIRLPGIILEPIKYIASLNTPLAMIISGITFAQSDVLKALKKPRIYLVSAIKLFIVPLIVLLVFSPFIEDKTIINTAVIAAACPTATATIMFAYKYKSSDAVYASELFALCTLLSAVTLPVLLIISSKL